MGQCQLSVQVQAEPRARRTPSFPMTGHTGSRRATRRHRRPILAVSSSPWLPSAPAARHCTLSTGTGGRLPRPPTSLSGVAVSVSVSISVSKYLSIDSCVSLSMCLWMLELTCMRESMMLRTNLEPCIRACFLYF